MLTIMSCDEAALLAESTANRLTRAIRERNSLLLDDLPRDIERVIDWISLGAGEEEMHRKRYHDVIIDMQNDIYRNRTDKFNENMYKFESMLYHDVMHVIAHKAMLNQCGKR
jgi:hypothetical protein